jgi:hypothetical protein
MPHAALSRSQILTFRRKSGGLDARLPWGADSLRKAAWAGLQDSVPRAALLSIHARVAGTTSSGWEHSSLVQLWGPRFNDYAIAARDLAVFSLGRLPLSGAQLKRAIETADRLHGFLEGRRMPFGEAGRAMGVAHNSLRYAAPTGRVLMRWDGARQPVVWTSALGPSDMTPEEARRELARRYLHILGPGTSEGFAKWAGVPGSTGVAVFRELVAARELVAVRTPVGDGWILASDEAAMIAAKPDEAEVRGVVRFLPSGDAFFLAWGADREILAPDARRRAELWTSRVWPGALLVHGEVAGVWRRASAEVTIDAWRKLTRAERESVEAEARTLPVPGIDEGRPIQIRWTTAAS